jgi:hypothetical protein
MLSGIKPAISERRGISFLVTKELTAFYWTGGFVDHYRCREEMLYREVCNFAGKTPEHLRG